MYQVLAGNAVTVTVDTLYPFSDTLTTTIQATHPFTYYVRIPSWSIGKATISINGASSVAAVPDSTTHLLKVSAGQGQTTFVLNLPADITLGEKCSCIWPKTKSSNRIEASWCSGCSAWTSSLCIRYCKKPNCPYPKCSEFIFSDFRTF